MSTLEVIVLNEEDARIAEGCGADRLELVSDIHEGGLTPDHHVIEQVVKAVSIPVQVMIRPHGRSFSYQFDEIDDMIKQIKTVTDIGVKGIVFGSLTNEGSLDVPALKKIIHAANRLSVTFHRAIDVSKDPVAICRELHQSGIHVDRILTSGGRSSVVEGVVTIKEMIEMEKYGGPIIMPGSGLTVENMREVHRRLNAREYHVGSGVRHDGRYDLGIDPQKVDVIKQVISSHLI